MHCGASTYLLFSCVYFNLVSVWVGCISVFIKNISLQISELKGHRAATHSRVCVCVSTFVGGDSVGVGPLAPADACSNEMAGPDSVKVSV